MKLDDVFFTILTYEIIIEMHNEMLFYILQAPSALPAVDMVESHMAQKAQSIVGSEVWPIFVLVDLRTLLL